MPLPPRRPAATLTFRLQNLIRSSLSVLSKPFKAFMRYTGNNICPDERTSGVVLQVHGRGRPERAPKIFELHNFLGHVLYCAWSWTSFFWFLSTYCILPYLNSALRLRFLSALFYVQFLLLTDCLLWCHLWHRPPFNLLLERLIGQYCFAGPGSVGTRRGNAGVWAVGAPAAGCVGGRAANITWRASRVTSR